MIRRSVFVSSRSDLPTPAVSRRENTEVFSSNDLAAMCHVSLRQLQWWDEERVIRPRHEGHRRIYSLDEAISVAVVAALRRRQLSLQLIRLRILKRLPAGLAAQMIEQESPLLVIGSNGREVRIDPNATEALETIVSMKAPAIVLDLARECGPLLLGVNRSKR